jgi:sodium/potassium-transporting ATPase subunit alpha
MTADAPRISSAEIVAVTTELRHRQAARRRNKRAGKAGGKGGAGGDDDAKRELVMEEHKMSISELVADIGTDAQNVSFGLWIWGICETLTG